MREFVTVTRHVSGSNEPRPCALTPTCGTLVCAAGLAQLVEQLSCKQQVIGSSPIAGSTESLTAAPQPPVTVTRSGEVTRPRQ